MSGTHENATYGFWTVIEPKSAHSRCRCVCGTERTVYNGSLYRGASKSCGCRQRDLTTATRQPKYLYREPEWVAWASMIQRCERPTAKAWADYGGRGIYVCDRWRNGENGKHGYECFISDLGPRPEGFSLERKDVNKGYDPENCVWASKTDQMNNKRTTRRVEYNGKVYSAAQFAALLGLPQNTVLYRLDKGWPLSDIAARPAGWRPTTYRRA